MSVTDVTATEAARRFADLLDAVERGEAFTIVRRGRAVAHLEPVTPRRGAALKEALSRHRPDEDWPADLATTRELLAVEQRN